MEKRIKELLSCKFKDIDVNALYKKLCATGNLEVATSLVLGLYVFPLLQAVAEFSGHTFEVRYFDPIRQEVYGVCTDSFDMPSITCSLSTWNIHGSTGDMVFSEKYYFKWRVEELLGLKTFVVKDCL